MGKLRASEAVMWAEQGEMRVGAGLTALEERAAGQGLLSGALRNYEIIQDMPKCL